MEGELGRLAHRPAEDEDGGQGQQRAAEAAGGDPVEDPREAQRPGVQEQDQDADHHREVAHPRRHKRLERRAGRRRALKPEPDQQVGAQAHQFPSRVDEEEVVGQDQEEHRELEQGQVGEEAREAGIPLHVPDGVDGDQRGDDAHHRRHHSAEGIDHEADGERPAAEHDPLIG